ncbi:sensor histidine kinase [Nonomuraea typhae]|uniref:sensor histidine kinase n=1 Tax=Nonomuraea typhae TaxID=2603600 RepID=UPI0012F7F071|nr:histidine kinase [Nonomuraea typhae]
MSTPSPADEARRAPVFLVPAMVAFMLVDLALYQYVQRTGGPLGPAAGLTLSLAVDACLPLLGRFPRTVALVACAATAMAAVGDTLTPGTFTPAEPATPVTAPLCTPLVVWCLTALPRRTTLAYVTVLALFAVRPWAPDWVTVYAGLTASVLPAVLGLYLRARRDLLRSLRERAESAERERRLLAEQAQSAQRERHLLAERAKADERQRLAGEMHDIVTHHVTEIVLAAGALKVSAPDQAVRSAAEHIRDVGARTLGELRDLFTVLRHDHPREPAEPARVMLTGPGLEALVDRAVAAGNPATLRVTGRPGAVTPAVARAAHRVLQEALTNARKHAPGTRVEVEVAYHGHTMTMTIANTPPVAASELAGSGSGMGLDGLRRRVTLLGGAFTAAPDTAGGFRVTATFPAPDSDSAPASARPETGKDAS